jgi:hypothetical protein
VNLNEVLQVPLSRYEMILIVNLIRKSVPDVADQRAVINIVERLQTIAKT